MRSTAGLLLLVCMSVLLGSSTPTSGASRLQNGCGSELNENCLDLEGVASAVLDIDPPDIDPEAVVISVASFWRESDRTGGVRIRAWSRQELIEETTPTLDVEVDRFDFRIRPASFAGSRAEFFDIVFTQPEDSAGSSSVLEPVVYDLISVFGIPTSTIEAAVNDLTSGVIDVDGVSGSGNAATTEIGAGTAFDTVDLSASIPVSRSVDQQVSGETSGLQVYYEYELRGAMATDKFPVEVSARILYGVSRRGDFGIFLPVVTDYATVTYLTTGEWQKVYLPIAW
jgi:hypothetical protein